jgi:hypothetical protein
MVGNEKKKVLAKLPAQFPNMLEPQHSDKITEIWKVHNYFGAVATISQHLSS